MRLPRKDGLNVIPFIDIMLVLLAIVLSSATFISQGQIKINVPESSSATRNNDISVKILLDSENRFYIDNKEVTLDALKLKIMDIDNSTLIELSSDSDAKFHYFISLLDILKEKGHENFTIKTKIKN